MSYAAIVLQWLYGGHDYEMPQWQRVARERLQTMNQGWHPGRYINCIEITIQALKTLLTHSPVFPLANPLSKLPFWVSDYANNAHERMLNLDETRRATMMKIEGMPSKVFHDYLFVNQFPLYTHMIILAELKKIPGGHALSAILLPDERYEGRTRIFFYDAQGFLPDSWLDPEQFDEFYTINYVYFYDSPTVQEAMQRFINSCKSAEPQLQAIAESSSRQSQIREHMIEFVKLELYRLQTKPIVSPGSNTEYLEEKIEAYEKVFSALISKSDVEPLILSNARLLWSIAQTVKCHRYSFNWFDPQSFKHFCGFFSAYSKQLSLRSDLSLESPIEVIANFLLAEVIRLCLINEYSNYYLDQKIEAYIGLLERLLSLPATQADLNILLQDIQKNSSTPRHWSGALWGSCSQSIYDEYLKPLADYLKPSGDASSSAIINYT